MEKKTSQRKFHRNNSHNLIHYVVLKQDGKPLHDYLGRTLNVSEGGILLETYKPLYLDRQVIITIAIDEEMIELTGRVVHVKHTQNDRFHSGNEFINLSEHGKRVLQWYMAAINDKKRKPFRT